MEKERYTFRLSDTTIKKLDELRARGNIQHRTDGVTRAVDQFYNKESLKDSPFLQMLASVTGSSFPAEQWPACKNGDIIMFPGADMGYDYIITKKGENLATIEQTAGDKRILLTIGCETLGKYHKEE